MLFVQGSRDAFGTSAEIAALLPSLQRAELHEVAGGDHSFKVSGRKGDGLESIMDMVAAWIQAVGSIYTARSSTYSDRMGSPSSRQGLLNSRCGPPTSPQPSPDDARPAPRTSTIATSGTSDIFAT
jgi:hypothetical protein